MNTLWIVVIGALVIYFAYNYYAKPIDRRVIQADAKRATPARMYLDGVDFMPASRNVLYGYHFKSIAAAGPIVAGDNRSDFLKVTVKGGAVAMTVVAPVKIGDTIRLKAKVTGKKDLSDPGHGLVTLQRTLLNQRDEVVQQGETDLIVEKRP